MPPLQLPRPCLRVHLFRMIDTSVGPLPPQGLTVPPPSLPQPSPPALVSLHLHNGQSGRKFSPPYAVFPGFQQPSSVHESHSVVASVTSPHPGAPQGRKSIFCRVLSTEPGLSETSHLGVFVK